jgi:D-alanyl-D-alanine carboxypeptidase/D-alanyl-D-alanine-endopeptidase (penicillin-binding protein 4)
MKHPLRRSTAGAALCAFALLAASPAEGLTARPATATGTAPDNPDRAFQTPVARGAAAARTAISQGALRNGLGAHLRAAGGRSAAWVLDAASGRLLFSSGARRKLQLASNTKLFTTATARGRFGPEERLRTTVWAGDDISDGVAGKGLYLRGEGDPALGSGDLGKLATRVAAAGVESVKGPLLYDDSFLDRRDGVRQRGIVADPLGTLSALTLDGGAGRSPERSAASRLGEALRRAGVSVGRKIRRRGLPPPTAGAEKVASVASPRMADLARLTNTPSNNFYAEMLLKDVAGAFGGRGSTGVGIKLVRRFAAERGSSFRGENGSGLSRVDRASTSSVGALLESMLEQDTAAEKELREAFIQSLAVAARSGTLADRMRGSAAAGRCAAKTGTLTGVSALSGYCFRPNGDATVFSILNNRVDTDRARSAQDRMAALIARYRP